MADASGKRRRGRTIDRAKHARRATASAGAPEALGPDLIEERLGIEDPLCHRRHDPAAMIDGPQPECIVEGEVAASGVPGRGEESPRCDFTPQADELAKIA